MHACVCVCATHSPSSLSPSQYSHYPQDGEKATAIQRCFLLTLTQDVPHGASKRCLQLVGKRRCVGRGEGEVGRGEGGRERGGGGREKEEVCCNLSCSGDSKITFPCHFIVGPCVSMHDGMQSLLPEKQVLVYLCMTACNHCYRRSMTLYIHYVYYTLHVIFGAYMYIPLPLCIHKASNGNI